MQRTELGLGTKFACLIHSPTKVTRVLRFAILARGVGMEEEAGKIREGLSVLLGLGPLRNREPSENFMGRTCAFKRLSCWQNEEWTGGNKMESRLCSHLVLLACQV